MINAMKTLKSSKNAYLFGINCLRVIACVLILNFVAACANQNTNAGVDLVTASDETDSQKRAKIRLELAVGYLDQGQPSVALDEVKLAIAADPRSADAYSLRGLIYMRLNDFGLARDSFNRGIALNPRDGNIMHNLGWLACQESRFAEAILNLDKALVSPNLRVRQKRFWPKESVFCVRVMQDKRKIVFYARSS
jgi:type IV pilus assembly protein PilF